ncbi:MAG: CAP domain-containing protein [Candidatus Dormibacteria bacterium]
MRRPVSIVAVLLCASCAAPPHAGGSPTATAAPAHVARLLATAQEDMFDNRYGAADSVYGEALAMAPQSADVRAALALFLAYRTDFSDALMQAQRAVAVDQHSGAAQAALCRVLDWSGSVSAAVTAGRTAIEVAATDPLARLFLSEALADSGDLTAAQMQLDAAKALIAKQPSAFLQAEALRETANLAGDEGKHDAQIAALQQSRSRQSGWLYRTAELVDAQMGAGQADAAQQTLDSVAAQTPDDVETLQTLGNDALFVCDAHAALGLWSRALALAPRDAAILDVNGELQVAANNDINAAVRLFQRALGADPHDAQAAAYLTALARFVQKQPDLGPHEIAAAVAATLGPRPIHLPSAPRPDVQLAAAASHALSAVNATRATAGLPPVQLDSRLSDSATSHAFYWLFNNLSPSVSGLGIHDETAGMTGYSGQFPWNRAVAYGYPNERIGEDITHRGDPTGAVRDWVNSVYHRFAIVRPDLTVIGYGQAHVGPLDMEDMEFGFAPPGSAAPVRYPGDGQTSVPNSFIDNELPDPVPAGAPRTTGYPVTVTFGQGDAVHLRGFTLSADGAELQSYMLAPSSETENSASLLPVAPLHRGSVYTAHISATVNGSTYDSTWSFTTTM